MSLPDYLLEPEDREECYVHILPKPCWMCREEAEIERAEGMKDRDDY